jgi:hypothetical protein
MKQFLDVEDSSTDNLREKILSQDVSDLNN